MKSNKKQIAKISIFITSIFIIFMSVSFAFINLTLQGTKRQVITAGILSLELDEDENNLTIEDALPMYDEVGMLQDAFTFRLINNGTSAANYKIQLVEAGTGTLSKSDVKYGLTKDGVNTIGLLSDLPATGVIDSGTIGASPESIEYSLRLWIKDTVTDNSAISGKSLSYRVDVEISQEIAKQKITFAGITEELNESTTTMFNYSSEGCIMDMTTGEQSCPVEPTNGIYMMEDDDGPSYFYRGDVDNLVQFGEYGADYYVYRKGSYDYVSLEACIYAGGTTETCVQTKKYDAGTPMYWRIIRINGDGTIRMIYSGTSVDAVQYETGIGVSRYNEEYNDPKYTGYTYDITEAGETKSDAKTEIDTWYSTYLATTEFDEYVADGKFCSNSSDYGEVTFMGSALNAFGPLKRAWANTFGLGNANPTFKCAETSETYGGSYTLKAGLITLDEIIVAGGQVATNNSYYLYNGTEGSNDGKRYWSMSPAGFSANYANVGDVYNDGYANLYYVNSSYGLLRPVINLKAGTSFQIGTDGSILTPYQIIR